MIQTNESYGRKVTKLIERSGFLGSTFAKFLTRNLKKNKSIFLFLVNNSLRFSERYELKVYRGILKEGMVVIDIGANVGLYSFEAAKLVGKSGKVIAFEPDPYNFEIFSFRLKKSGIKNITLVNKALSNAPGVTKLFIDPFSPGNHSFSSDNLYSGNDYVEVPTVKLDDYLSENNIKKVDVIKIDVQGAEGLVFEGAANILKNNDIKMLMEFWPHGMEQVTQDAKKVMQELEDFGYTFTVLDKKVKDLQVSTVKELFDMSDKWSAETDYTNLLLKKQISANTALL